MCDFFFFTNYENRKVDVNGRKILVFEMFDSGSANVFSFFFL